MSIIKLDQNTINQIAAGEVVDRPSSVVKELVENSIDAGATSITVEIKEGGISLIRITDNGSGIDKSDIKIAFERHATSKIKDALDLADISSLGFRGEALSSIAAIARVELITKTDDELTGFRYLIEGGKEISFEEIGAPNGTTFVVRNIFYNTPARRKFLKSPSTEGSYISDIVEKIALSHPEISFDFIINGKNKLHTPGNGSLKDTIYAVFGKDITQNLISIKCSDENFEMEGYIGRAAISKGNRNGENYFINGRFIKSDILTKAIEDGYKFILMQHKYPFTVVNFKINNDLIDVNVHPAKMELRFRNSAGIYQTISDCVAATLVEKPAIDQIKLVEEKEEEIVSKIPEIFETNRRSEETDISINKPETPRYESVDYKSIFDLNKDASSIDESKIDKEYNIADNQKATFIQPGVDKPTTYNNQPELNNVASNDNQLTMESDKFFSEAAKPKHKIIGQVFDTYWIIEYNDSMYIIDQHAAHEKVNFEDLMARLKNNEVETQMLVAPIIISVSMHDADLLNKYLDKFAEVGFIIEHFGGEDFAVRGVPAKTYNLDSEEVLKDIIDNFTDEVGNMVPDSITDKIASMSCKAAIKGNTKISYQEADKLISRLLELENPYNCPHGRPTIISFTKSELDKKFKRIL